MPFFASRQLNVFFFLTVHSSLFIFKFIERPIFIGFFLNLPFIFKQDIRENLLFNKISGPLPIFHLFLVKEFQSKFVGYFFITVPITGPKNQ